MATRRVVLQGDRIYFRHQSFERVRRDEVSPRGGLGLRRRADAAPWSPATARTSTSADSQHPDISPAHSLPLAHYRVNFPLSVYLGGTEAIHAHLRYPQEGRRDRLDGTSSARSDPLRWRGGGRRPPLREGPRGPLVRARTTRPTTQHLWLAPERNYHLRQGAMTSGHEMRVDELREVAPGVWFPARITVVSTVRGPDQAKQVVAPHRDDRREGRPRPASRGRLLPRRGDPRRPARLHDQGSHGSSARRCRSRSTTTGDGRGWRSSPPGSPSRRSDTTTSRSRPAPTGHVPVRPRPARHRPDRRDRGRNARSSGATWLTTPRISETSDLGGWQGRGVSGHRVRWPVDSRSLSGQDPAEP